MNVRILKFPKFPSPNVASHLPRMAAIQPERVAVAVARGRAVDGSRRYDRLTFAELDDECDRLAWGLQAVGLSRGQRVVLMVPPSLEFFTLTFALFKIGAVPVLVDPGMGLPSLKKCLEEAEPRAFIGTTKAHLARTLFGWAPGADRLVTVGPRLFWGGKTLEQVRAAGRALPHQVADVEPSETAAILFTSGSTGVPKGAVYRHEVFAAQVEMLRSLYGIRPGEMDLATFPLFALFGPALGMSAIVPEMDASKPGSADPEKLVAAIEDFGCTNMFGSPALVDRLSRHGERLGLKLPTLKRVLSAGAPVRGEVLARMQGLLSEGAQVFTPYGATEVLPVCSIGSDELQATLEATGEGAGVCVGRPAEGNELKIIRIDDGPIERWSDELELPAGEIGEIVVRGPTVTHAYHGRPESTALAKISDGARESRYPIWHRMGDLGRLDEEGRLWFQGRKAHRVVLPGGTLFTVPCERVFDTHPAVRRTALVGIEREGARQPVICVELEPGIGRGQHARITAELRRLGAWRAHTRKIERFLFHPGFPVDVRHNAKIFREKLALWAQEVAP
ncbi:MAG: fatty acid CoA ligase family protein [Deltaproteobacteria bacterium]|nr:fatty acid CoA ligase family protein [Deltaproteobacteria bacterium]